MNEFAGFTRPVPGGHWAMLRFARDGQPKPLMNGDKPFVFPTEVEALRAVNCHLLAYFNGHLVRSGEIIGSHRQEAESYFTPQKERARA
ncbi:hypothetical protein [Rhizobium sp. AC27/96]|uniref:hypothetical protein n=1 Tax=Rhizobium sp. AC27/96 TaxID=1841653 RepID=UPI00114629C2|nr:hypothetical protein [Rhizobium sp. AC27/96]